MTKPPRYLFQILSQHMPTKDDNSNALKSPDYTISRLMKQSWVSCQETRIQSSHQSLSMCWLGDQSHAKRLEAFPGISEEIRNLASFPCIAKKQGVDCKKRLTYSYEVQGLQKDHLIVLELMMMSQGDQSLCSKLSSAL